MELSYQYGFAKFLQNLNVISFFVVIILLSMSLLSWYLIFIKALQLGFTYWRSNKILNLFWKSSSLVPLIEHLIKTKPTNPYSNLALQGINAAIYYEKRSSKKLITLTTHSEFIVRNMRRAIKDEMAFIDSGLTTLAIISSTAPFIGFFGTLWDIYDALISISAKGNVSLDTVTAVVGEALIMTAVGLAVAIPAVLGYNAFVHGNRDFLNKLEGFAHELHTRLNTGVSINLMKNRVYMKKNGGLRSQSNFWQKSDFFNTIAILRFFSRRF